VAEYFVKTAGIPRRLITIVPNGVDVTGFEFDRDTARRELGLNADEIVIGTVGRLEPEKDQITLLDAFRQLQMRHPRARLIIAGDGSMADQLKSHADRIGAAAAIRFLGYRRDIARLLAAMDVFLLTSIREGLPVSLIEAMAARRPVVASSIGSVRDLISDGKTGLLVAPGNVDGFRAAIERLIDDSSLRQNFVERARATIEASFSLPAVISAYETLYRSAKMNRHVRN
jgi:L-malate glycosyltransferase